MVDDPATTTRFFVIQGSDTLDHWRVNLTFDPVAFEDASLGVKVCCRALTAHASHAAPGCVVWGADVLVVSCCLWLQGPCCSQ